MSSPTKKDGYFPLHILSALVILSADWLVYACNMLTELDALTTMIVVGSLMAGAACAYLERRVAHASWSGAFGYAAFAAIVVALPLPVLGTFVFGLALVWWLGTSAIHPRNHAHE